MHFHVRVGLLLSVLVVCVVTAQPLTHESFVLDTTPVWLPVDSIEEMPAVTASGSGFLAVWRTRRGTDFDVHAARITHSGATLDPDGFVISGCSLDQASPQAAEGVRASLVVWEDWRSGTHCEIYGARVDTGGNVLDPEGFLIHSGLGDSRRPTLAFGHGRWLVLWDEYNSGWAIRGAFVDTAGQVGATISVSNAVSSRLAPSVAPTDSGFVAAWEDWRNGQYPQVWYARIDPAGLLLDSSGLQAWPDGYDQTLPAIARCGGNLLIAWEESALLDADVWGIRLSPTGGVLDSAPIRIGSAPGPQRQPRLATRGDNVLATWADSRNSVTRVDIYAARVRSDGSVENLRLVVGAPGTQDQPCVAWGDTLGLLLWRDMAGDTLYKDIRAARMSAGDSVLDPSGFSVIDLQVPEYYGQSDPSVAAGGGCFLVTWADARNQATGHDIYGLRLSSAGEALDSAPFAICRATGLQQSPQLAFNGSCHLAVWQDSRSSSRALYGARVDTLGRVLDTVNIVLSNARCYETAVCSDGERWLVTWRATVNGQLDILGTFVEADGRVTHPGGFHVTSTSQPDYRPAVSYGGERFLVAWQAVRTSQHALEILANRLARDGTLLDTARYYSNLPGNDAGAALAFDGEDFLAVWVDHFWSTYAIYCMRVDTAGVAIDSPPVLVQQFTNYHDDVDVVFNGAHHYLAWAEQTRPDWQIKGARVGRNTAVFDTFLLVTREQARPIPSLAADLSGGMLMVYAGRVDSINGRPVGVDHIKGVLSPYGGIKEGGIRHPEHASGLRAQPSLLRGAVRIIMSPMSGGSTSIEIVNSTGRVVRGLRPGRESSVVWDGTDESGRDVPKGVYFVTLRTPELVERVKVVKVE